MTKKQKVAIVTFSAFLCEALIHYNISKKESGEDKDKFFILPPKETILRMALVTSVTTLISVSIIHLINGKLYHIIQG